MNEDICMIKDEKRSYVYDNMFYKQDYIKCYNVIL